MWPTRLREMRLEAPAGATSALLEGTLRYQARVTAAGCAGSGGSPSRMGGAGRQEAPSPFCPSPGRRHGGGRCNHARERPASLLAVHARFSGRAEQPSAPAPVSPSSSVLTRSRAFDAARCSSPPSGRSIPPRRSKRLSHPLRESPTIYPRVSQAAFALAAEATRTRAAGFTYVVVMVVMLSHPACEGSTLLMDGFPASDRGLDVPALPRGNPVNAGGWRALSAGARHVT
jgi:hypothetical protein